MMVAPINCIPTQNYYFAICLKHGSHNLIPSGVCIASLRTRSHSGQSNAPFAGSTNSTSKPCLESTACLISKAMTFEELYIEYSNVQCRQFTISFKVDLFTSVLYKVTLMIIM